MNYAYQSVHYFRGELLSYKERLGDHCDRILISFCQLNVTVNSTINHLVNYDYNSMHHFRGELLSCKQTFDDHSNTLFGHA